MRVYYKNKVTAGDVTSLDISPLSSLENLFHRYLDYPAEFISESSAAIDINAHITINSILLSVTNAKTIKVSLHRDGDVIDTFTVTDIQKINRIRIGETVIDSARIELLESTDGALLYLGAVYFGDGLTLPRFTVEPSLEEDFLQASKRSFGGYAYGLDGESLRQCSLDFRRINRIDYLRTLDYLREVGKTKPHYIDIYEEANETWPIMYGTLQGDFKPVKRPENDFYFDYSLEYQEAK